MSELDILQSAREILLNPHTAAYAALVPMMGIAYASGRHNGIENALDGYELPEFRILGSQSIIGRTKSFWTLATNAAISFAANGIQYGSDFESGQIAVNEYGVNVPVERFLFEPIQAITGGEMQTISDTEPLIFSQGYFPIAYILTRGLYEIGYTKGHNSVTQAEHL